MKIRMSGVVGRLVVVASVVAIASPARAATYMTLRDASFTAPNGLVLSDDGRVVVFSATMTATGTQQAFVLDRRSGRVEAVSARRDAPAAPARAVDVNGNGRFVLFAAEGGTLFVRDRIRRTNRAVASGVVTAAISADGATVAFEAALEGGKRAVYAYSTRTRQVTPVSTDDADVLRHGAAPDVSGNGRYVAFQSGDRLTSAAGSGLSEVYVRDLVLGTTVWVSSDRPVGMADSSIAVHRSAGPPMIDADAQFVSYVVTDSPRIVGGAVKTSLVVKKVGTGSVLLLGSATVVPERPHDGRVALAAYGGWAFFVAKQQGDVHPGVFRQSLLDGAIERVVDSADLGCSAGTTPCALVSYQRLAPAGDGTALAFETTTVHALSPLKPESVAYVRS